MNLGAAAGCSDGSLKSNGDITPALPLKESTSASLRPRFITISIILETIEVWVCPWVLLSKREG